MNRKRLSYLAAVSLLISVAGRSGQADPCGMVPPVNVGVEVPIKRVGEQKTYVFYKDGVETFVIRPGFSGKTDEFGMLIPFPTPPALRKMPDHIFPHTAAAIDPPEVVVRVQRFFLRSRTAKSAAAGAVDDGLEFKKDEVRVIKKEAVGMYEVVVLEAGSAAALKKWMNEHDYKYPNGMDKVCDEYVADGWCFVAVKTKVGQKEGVDPRPGQRSVDSKLPDGSTFDGHVQAMGFRFKTDKLVVPMRLSAFNEGKLRNIVYLLTDGPRRIESIPEEYVVRQVSGEQLLKNVTDLLPVRVIGGTIDQIPQYYKKNLPKMRDPEPKNGAAKNMFASDLLAVKSGQMSLPHEEKEKELLRIGEHLGLRGPQIDKLNHESISEMKRETVKKAIDDLKGMTMTVVDGDFPREVVAGQNLTFAEYKMPARRNSSQSYDPKVNGPAPKKQGVLKRGEIKTGSLSPQGGATQLAENDTGGPTILWWMLSGLGVALAGLAVFAGPRRRGRAAAGLLIACLVLSATQTSFAAEEPAEKKTDDAAAEKEKPSIRELINRLSHADKADAAVKALVARGKEAVPQLYGEAIEGGDIARRGWAIVALGEIGGDDVDAKLKSIHEDGNQSMLIRTWAAAARVYMTESTDGLIKKASLVQQFPALGRPVGMRIVDGLRKDKEASVEDMISISLKISQLNKALAPAIMAAGAEKLTDVMVTAEDQQVRRQAAAYLGTLFAQGEKTVPDVVNRAYQFDPEAKEVPWSGGPLFVPGISWPKEQAQALVKNLVAWHVWLDRKGGSAGQKQIHNNIRSLSLARAAGYNSPGFREIGTVEWLMIIGQAFGKEAVLDILKEQGLEDNAKYLAAVKGL